MIILEDTRQQALKHKLKHAYFAEHGIKVERTKIFVGDYTLPTNQSVCIDTKKDIQELISDICGKQHQRFKQELLRAKESGIKLIVLVENRDGVKEIEDLIEWQNPRLLIMKNSDEIIGTYSNGKPKYKKVQKFPSATKGETLFKVCRTMQERYGVAFDFCTPEESGERIINILTT